jgi:hypothetical protein
MTKPISSLSGFSTKHLPDCIIHATGLLYASEILTRNPRDFPDFRGNPRFDRDWLVQARQPYR